MQEWSPHAVRAETPEEGAMRVDQLMSRNVVTIGIDESCDQALNRMVRSKVRHLPVLDAGGTLRGVLTDRDLRHQLFAPGVLDRIGRIPTTLLLRERPVRAAMSAPAICLGATAGIDEAAGIMRQHRIGSLPVLDAGTIVGILTETDLLRHLAGAEACQEPEIDIIVSYP
jgi:acetoin utilization protein AcuB